MTRKHPSEPTIKKLFALSGNKCYFPSCDQEIIVGEEIVVDICHIEAANINGERYNPNQTDEYRRSFDNLLLLCPSHHRITDDESIYTVDLLKKIKSDHEKKFKNSNYSITNNVLNKAVLLYENKFIFVNQINNYNIESQREKNDWGIVSDIFEYLFKTKIKVIADVGSRDQKLLNLSKKIDLNFPKDQVVRLHDMLNNIWSKKELIHTFLSIEAENDVNRVLSLKEDIQSAYCKKIGIDDSTKNIGDVRIVEELSLEYLEINKRKNPEYVANAKALILYFFELCDIGRIE